jgi:hypothetical protein
LKVFWRDLIIAESMSIGELRELSGRAFRNIEFAEETWNQIKNLEGAYETHRNGKAMAQRTVVDPFRHRGLEGLCRSDRNASAHLTIETATSTAVRPEAPDLR